MDKPHYTALVFLIVMLMTISNGCDKVYESGLVPIPKQPISGAVEIGSEWTEIIPPQPLKPLGKLSKINFRCSIDDNKPIDKDGSVIYLKDGRTTKVEAVISDNKGEKFDLGIAGYGNGFIMYRKMSSEVKGEKPFFSGDFPQDRIYTKLIVRSEIPLKCDNIEWISYVPH